jgi:signal transduction histidine kinase
MIGTLPFSLATLVEFVLGALVLQSAFVAAWLAQRGSRLNVEAALAESHEQLGLISSPGGIGLWTWDMETDEIWASELACGILGLEAGTWRSREFMLATVDPEDRVKLRRALQGVRCSGDALEMELRLVDSRWVTVRARAHLDTKKGTLKVAGCLADASERKRIAAQMVEQGQQDTQLTQVAVFSELTGAIAHELQQPFASILWNAQAAQFSLLKERPGVKEIGEILDDIVNDGVHAAQIIQRLSGVLARGERKSHAVALRDIMSGVVSIARGVMSGQGVQLYTTVDIETPLVQGDRFELQQVLLNLVLNACESMSATAPGERRIDVVVAVEPGEQAVRVSVMDRGRGIDADRLERVFDPFFTTKEGGLGLGLSICHAIIEAHGGRLWVANRPDRGAAFHFTVPVVTGDCVP